MTTRRTPARTVKGKDIELHASDGQAVRTDPRFLPQRQPDQPKPGTLGAMMARSPFRKAAKVLRGE